MPQFDPTTFTPQLFWLVVTFAVLFVAMWRHALPRLSDILEARQERIEADLKKATTLKEQADKVLGEYEQALAKARDRASTAVKRASDEIAAESAKRHETFGQDLARKTRAAEQQIAAARDEALTSVTVVAAEVARAATAKLIGAEVPDEQARKAVDATMRDQG